MKKKIILLSFFFNSISNSYLILDTEYFKYLYLKKEPIVFFSGDFSGFDFSIYKNLSNSKFCGSNFSKATSNENSKAVKFGVYNNKITNFNGVDLTNSDFSNCNCTFVNFKGANLKNCNFNNSNCEQADFTAANLDGITTLGATFYCAKMPNGNSCKSNWKNSKTGIIINCVNDFAAKKK